MQSFKDNNKKALEERKLLEDKLIRLKRELVTSKQSLEQVAQVISDNIKRPMQKINALVEFIKLDNESILSQESHEFFDCISELALKSEKVIEGIIELNELTIDNEELTTVDLSEALIELINDMSISDRCAIINDVNPPPAVNINKEKFQSALSEIFNNSLKYQDPEIPIEIKCRLGVNNEYVYMNITDNCRGLHIKDPAMIFEPFVSGVNTTSLGGRGLGLAFAKKIIESFGGVIRAENIESQGCTISIFLPLGPNYA